MNSLKNCHTTITFTSKNHTHIHVTWLKKIHQEIIFLADYIGKLSDSDKLQKFFEAYNWAEILYNTPTIIISHMISVFFTTANLAV